MRRLRFLLGMLVAVCAAAPASWAIEGAASDAHVAALRARMQQRKQVIARNASFAEVEPAELPWRVRHPGLYEALITHHATFLDPAAPHVLHDHGSWKLEMGPTGFSMTSKPRQGVSLREAFEAMGIRDEAAFNAFLVTTLRKLAPGMAAEHRTDAGLVRGVTEEILAHTEHVRGLTSRPDAVLLRDYFAAVTKKLDHHADGIDIGRDGEALLLNQDDHVTYGGKNVAPSNRERHVPVRRATELELARTGLLEPAPFDKAVQRKLLALAGLDTRNPTPALLEQARVQLKARMQEVADLERYLVDPSQHPELALLDEVRSAAGIRELRLAVMPFGTPHRRDQTYMILSLGRLETERHGRVHWRLGSAYSNPIENQQATVGRLVDFGLDTKQAFDALIRAKLHEFTPEHIPLSL